MYHLVDDDIVELVLGHVDAVVDAQPEVAVSHLPAQRALAAILASANKCQGTAHHYGNKWQLVVKHQPVIFVKFPIYIFKCRNHIEPIMIKCNRMPKDAIASANLEQSY